MALNETESYPINVDPNHGNVFPQILKKHIFVFAHFTHLFVTGHGSDEQIIHQPPKAEFQLCFVPSHLEIGQLIKIEHTVPFTPHFLQTVRHAV